MTFEDSVEKGLRRCLEAAGAGRDPNHEGYDGASLLVAVSAGVDSTALLLALKNISRRQAASPGTGGRRLGLELHACHVNHHLRGAESAADEQFCHEMCQALEIPLIVADIENQVPPDDSEATLRSHRYERLVRAAKQISAPYIVTAHNLDDQIETLIFRLMRGTSLRGLTGMQPTRPLEAAPWPILLRPLLYTERRDITTYLTENGITARFDQSNNNIKYSRNFLRHNIIPPLKQRFPSMLANIEHFRITLKNENDYLTEQSKDLYNRALTRSNGLLLSVLAGEHVALLARVITLYIEQAGIMPSFERVSRVLQLIEQSLQSTSKDFEARLSLGENLELLVSKDRVLLKPLFELSVSTDEYQLRLEVMSPISVKMPRAGRSSATTMVPWLNYAVSISEISPFDEHRLKPLERSALTARVNLTDVKDRLCIRPRHAGDHLQPLGMDRPVRLKQYLHANKSLFAAARQIVPTMGDILALRLFPVLALAESQEVLWVPGFGLSEKIKADGQPSYLISLVPLGHDLSGPASARIDGDTC